MVILSQQKSSRVQFYRRTFFGQTARPQAIDDRQGKDERVSNEEWMSRTDPDNRLLPADSDTDGMAPAGDSVLWEV
jgi:hypothetical protein